MLVLPVCCPAGIYMQPTHLCVETCIAYEALRDNPGAAESRSPGRAPGHETWGGEKGHVVAAFTRACTHARTRVDAAANVLRTFKVTNSFQPIGAALGSLIDACVSPAHARPCLANGEWSFLPLLV